jgi:DNA-binding NarL/FixJ family response regulator
MTHIPEGEIIKLISEEVMGEDSDNPLSLWDEQAIAFHQEEQSWEQQQALRLTVQQEFEDYLREQLGEGAVQWLQLYLQGKTQEAIAQTLNLPIKQIYRLREKISYHAVRVFAIKSQPELVTNWLEISLQEHSLGLTTHQWQEFRESLTPDQQKILSRLQTGLSLETIAKEENFKLHQVVAEWSRIYLAAQEIRSS